VPNQIDGDLVRALSQLSPRQRAVLHLGEIEGLTDEEVATTLGLRPATVRVHRQRGRQRLRQILEGGSRD
jgi:RNA polymerase sigma-70 factor (ECF subfamily)